METYGIAYALIFTILIEYAVLRCLGERRRKVLLSSVLVNILTNVPLNLYILYIGDSVAEIAVLEIMVVLAETAWYYLFTRKMSQSLVYSVLCNSISFLTGLLMDYIPYYLKTIV